MAVITRLVNHTSSITSFSHRCLSSQVISHAPPHSHHFPPRKDRKDRNVQYVFLGCPGVGKGTYATRLSAFLGVPYIATVKLVPPKPYKRPRFYQLSKIVNQGKVLDEIIISSLSKRLADEHAKGASGFILDGFPHTLKQAEMLEEVIDIGLVVNLKLPEEALLAKSLGRRTCGSCGGIFNVASINIKGENGRPGMYIPPLLPPPHCMEHLYTTAQDDVKAVVKERLRIYNKMTKPVEEFYRSRGKLMEFDLPGGYQESWPKLLQALNLEDYEKTHSVPQHKLDHKNLSISFCTCINLNA